MMIAISATGILAALMLVYIIFGSGKYRKRWIPGFLSSISLIIIAYTLTAIKTPTALSTSFDTVVVGEVNSLEYRDNDWIRIVLKPEAFDTALQFKRSDKLLLMVRGPLKDSLQEGNRLIIKGEVMPLSPGSNPNSFDYSKYLRNKGFVGQMFISSSDLRPVVGRKPKLKYLPQKIRAKCMTIYSKYGMSDKSVAVVQALLLGDRSGIDREINEHFIKSGAVHILSVSGLHVGIIHLLITALLAPIFKANSPAKWTVSTIALLAYSFIAGFSPSVSRAAFMFSVVSAGKLSSRRSNIYNLVCLSASLLLIINPLSLFNAGFLLSHMAVIGIAAFYRPINNLFNFRFVGFRHLWSLVALSLSAQLSTVPLSIYLFGAFPAWFILSNLIIVPICTPIIISAVGILIFSPLPFVAKILVGICDDLLLFMTDIAATIEQLPGSYLQHLWISLPIMLILYLAIIYLYRIMSNPGYKSITQFIAILAIVTGGFGYQHSIKLKSSQLVVYDVNRAFLMDLVDKGKVFTIQSDELDERSKSFARDGNLKKLKLNSESGQVLSINQGELPGLTCFSINNNRVALIHGTGKIGQFSSKDLNSDILIIAGSINCNIDAVIDSSQCKTIVTASNCPRYLTNKWQQVSEQRGLSYHSVNESGAYVLKRRK